MQSEASSSPINMTSPGKSPRSDRKSPTVVTVQPSSPRFPIGTPTAGAQRKIGIADGEDEKASENGAEKLVDSDKLHTVPEVAEEEYHDASDKQQQQQQHESLLRTHGSFPSTSSSYIVFILFDVLFGCGCNLVLYRAQRLTDARLQPQQFQLWFLQSGRYAGIWFNNIPLQKQTVVWVANSDSPINDSSGVIKISKGGNLVVTDGRGRVHWSTNVSRSVAAASARLLNTGNLALQDNGDKKLWESFEHPQRRESREHLQRRESQNAFLPTMTLSSDARTGKSLMLRSWKNQSDPSPGSYSAGVIPLPFPELAIWKDDLMVWRSGPWNGQNFLGLPGRDSRISLYGFALANDKQGSHESLFHFLLDSEGYAVEKVWSEVKQEWRMGLMFPTNCDIYGKCGQFTSCQSGGFEPRSYAEWNRGNWTQGCVRKTPLQCQRRDNNGSREGDGFLRLKKMKVPNNPQRSEVNEQDCPGSCLRNCSCTAYIYDTGLGCLLWSGNLIDMQEFLGSGVPIYIRLAGSELKSSSNRSLVNIAWKLWNDDEVTTRGSCHFGRPKQPAFIARRGSPDVESPWQSDQRASVNDAWKLWNDGDVTTLVDPVILDECSENKIHRCVHIGLLCVQDHANDRPSVSTVIWMLSTENSNLPEPKQPALIARRGSPDTESPWQSDQRASVNDVSITEITGLVLSINFMCDQLGFELYTSFIRFITSASCTETNTEMKIVLLIFFFSLLQYCISNDTIMRRQSLRDGDVILSEGERFAFGFFSLGDSKLRYVGIWYAQISEQTIVWVANRDHPINDTSGLIKFNSRGNLCVYASVSETELLWSTNVSDSILEPALVARLSDLGNLVLLDSVTGRVFWESFDHPTNTFLPFMRLGFTRKDSLDRFLTSWRSSGDPGSGNRTFRMEQRGSPQLILYKGQIPLWRTGSWTGQKWSGVPDMTRGYIFNNSFVNSQDEVSFTYGVTDVSVLTRLIVNERGHIQRFTWIATDKRWNEFYSVPKEECDYYAHCGVNGHCDPTSAETFECTCLPGFEPKIPRHWFLRDYSGGCSKKNRASICREKEGFVKLTRAKIPDATNASVDMNITLKECKQRCLMNCSCVAYASAYHESIKGAIGCLTWHGDMFDTRTYLNSGQDFYIRVDAEELARWNVNGLSRKRRVVMILVSLIAALMLVTVIMFCFVRKRRRKSYMLRRSSTTFSTSTFDFEESSKFEQDKAMKELPLFELNTIAAATNNFSSHNKLGAGGFGPVYKIWDLWEKEAGISVNDVTFTDVQGR
ncbi:unnamed protein product [Thlaspi arvense]|uniref:non-specific serine/threonine protein kinase n=1 Tax=Thlaspi arvense TaxID=13288 RepID=A0AAU9RCQ3_THLAR|nr:unnamed protein product [Thlaspi arvense]